MKTDLISRRIFPAICAGAFLAPLCSGCFDAPPHPVAPRWEVGLTAPISAKSYTLNDLVSKDPDILQIGAGNQIVYQVSAQSTASTVGDVFRIDPQSATTRARLGPLTIGILLPLIVQVSIPGLSPGQDLPPLSHASLPPASTTITQFESVTIRDGTLFATVQNHLPVELTIDSTITIRDDSGLIILALTFPDPVIPSGSFRTASADLAGKTITQHVSLANVSISEPGGGAVPSGSPLTVILTSTTVIATEAVLSSIPPQVLLENSTFSMPLRDSSKVREVRIRTGTLTLNVRSAVDLNMQFAARFPQLARASGEIFVDSFFLARGATATRTIILNGLRLRSTTGGLIDQLEATTSVDLYEGSAGRPVTVSENDSVRVTVSTTTISVDTVVGVVKPTRFAINERIPLRLGETASHFHGQMVIPAANLVLQPQSSITFAVRLDLAITARDAEGNEVVLPVPASNLTPPFGPITFAPGEVGKFLTRVSGALPDTVQLVGTVIVNPEYDTTRIGAAGSRSTFEGAVDFSVPLTLSIGGGAIADTVAFGDTTGDGNSEYAVNADLLNDINGGKVHIDIDNGLPLGMSLTLTLLDKMRTPLLILPQTAGDSLSVAPGVVAGGEVVAPARSSRLVQLSKEEVRLFERAKYVRYGIGLATPGPGTVTFRSDQSLRFRIWSELSYQMSE